MYHNQDELQQELICPMCGFKLEHPRRVDWNGVVGYSYRCKTENRIIWIQVVPYEWKGERTMKHYIPYVGKNKDCKNTYDTSKVTCLECLKMLKKEIEQ